MEDQIRIVRLKAGTGRYYVTLSTRSEPLTVSDELVHRHRLKEGIVLTAPQLVQLEAEASKRTPIQEAARQVNGESEGDQLCQRGEQGE